MKFLRFLSDPILILLIILFLSLIFILFNKKKLALLFGFISFLGFLSIIIFDPGQLILKYLDDRFAKPEIASDNHNIDGFIILGGVVDTLNSAERGEILFTDRAERITEMPILMKNYPNAKIIFTGAGKNGSEGQFAIDYLNAIGFDGNKVLIEGESSTTYENAAYTFAKFQPQPNENWYLVTSAWHMPRSIGVFRKAGWANIKAWPVDYQSGQHYQRVHRFSVGSRFYNISLAIREITGLTAYYLQGRTDEWIPKGENHNE